MTDWSEERPTIDLVKQTVTMVEVAEMLGFEPDRNDKIRPPWNESERTPSCQLYDDHFHDFATGRWGDFVDFIQAVDPDITHSKAVSLTWRRALRAGREPGDVERQPPRQLEDFTGDLERYPFGEPGFGVRTDGSQQLIPHAEPGRVYGVKTRSPGGPKGSWPGSQFTHRLYCPYGHPVRWPFGDVRCVVIAEGESDAWALTYATDGDVRVLALPSGASAWKDHWLADLDGQPEIWLCMDNDHAGKQALDKLQRKIGWDRTKVLRVPALFNDAREAIEAGWQPALH